MRKNIVHIKAYTYLEAIKIAKEKYPNYVVTSCKEFSRMPKDYRVIIKPRKKKKR